MLHPTRWCVYCSSTYEAFTDLSSVTGAITPREGLWSCIELDTARFDSPPLPGMAAELGPGHGFDELLVTRRTTYDSPLSINQIPLSLLRRSLNRKSNRDVCVYLSQHLIVIALEHPK
jgi:hypothetical protein